MTVNKTKNLYSIQFVQLMLFCVVVTCCVNVQESVNIVAMYCDDRHWRTK